MHPLTEHFRKQKQGQELTGLPCPWELLSSRHAHPGMRYPITVLSASCKEKGWCGFRIILRAEKLLDDFQIANIFTMKSWKKWWGWINTHTHKEVIFCIFRKRSKFACGCYWGFFVPGNKFGIFVLIGKSVRCQGFWREPIKKTCSGNLSKRLKTQSLPLRY